MSPQKIETYWNRLREMWVERLLKVPRVLLFFSLTMASLIMIPILLRLWTFPYPEWTQINNARDRLPVSLFIFGFSLLSFWIPTKWRPHFLIITGISSWIGFYLSKRIGLASCFTIPVINYLGFLVVATSKELNSVLKRILLMLVILACFFGIVYWLGWWSLATQDRLALKTFWSIHPEYLLVLIMAYLLVYRSETKTALWPLFLNPMNFLNPMPWMPSTQKIISQKEKHQELWISGFFDVITAQFLFLIFFAFLQWTASRGAPSYFIEPLQIYFPFLLVVNAVSLFTQGMTRMFGLITPDITEFLFLPRLPSEVWARGNQLVYNFIYQGIYIPIYRRFKSMIFSLVVALIMIFFMMFLFHEVVIRWFYQFFFAEFKIQPWNPSHVILFACIWGLWWMLLFGFSQRIKKWIYQTSTRQWIGIIGTHLLSAYGFALCYKVLPGKVLQLLAHIGGGQ